MRNFNKISCDEIRLGMRFSAPVFFDDGENMFLAEGKTVKLYHMTALARWKIPYLLTFGHVITEPVVPMDCEEVEELVGVDEVEDLESVF